MRSTLPTQPGCQMVFLSCRMNLGGSISDPYEIVQHQRKFSIYNQDDIQTARRNKQSLKNQKKKSQFSQSYAIRVNSQIVSSLDSHVKDGIQTPSSSAILPRDSHREYNNTNRTQKMMKKSLKHSNRQIASNERQTHQRSNYQHDKQNQYLKETRQMTEMLNLTDKNIKTERVALNYYRASNQNHGSINIQQQPYSQRRVMTEENKNIKAENTNFNNLKIQNMYQSQFLNEAAENYQLRASKTMNIPPKPTTLSVTLHDKQFFPSSTLSTLPRNPVLKKQSLLQGKISGKTSITDLQCKFLNPNYRMEADQPIIEQIEIKKQCKVVSPTHSAIPSHKSSPLASNKAISQANRNENIKNSLNAQLQRPSHSSHPSDPSNTHLHKISSPRHLHKFHTLADISSKQVDSSGGERTSSNHVSIVGSHNSINQSNPNSNVEEFAKCIKMMTLKTMPLNQNLWSSWHQNKFQKQ